MRPNQLDGRGANSSLEGSGGPALCTPRQGECYMRAVIAGKRYDTENAERIATWSSGHSLSDWHFIEESLYRTKRGNWFIAGQGGGLSRYRQFEGGWSYPGEQIRPVSPEEAMQWLEEHGHFAKIEEYFADSVEDA